MDDVGEGKGYGAFTKSTNVPKTSPASLDWGSAYNAQHAGENWTTLTPAEWSYLVNTREVNGGIGKDYTCQEVKFNGIIGLIIYCDGYDKTSYRMFAEIPSDGFPEGCVFLPEVGRRYNTNIFNSKASDTRKYWLRESNSPDNGVTAYFNDSDVGCEHGFARGSGLSVRLVSPVSSAGK